MSSLIEDMHSSIRQDDPRSFKDGIPVNFYRCFETTSELIELGLRRGIALISVLKDVPDGFRKGIYVGIPDVKLQEKSKSDQLILRTVISHVGRRILGRSKPIIPFGEFEDMVNNVDMTLISRAARIDGINCLLFSVEPGNFEDPNDIKNIIN